MPKKRNKPNNNRNINTQTSQSTQINDEDKKLLELAKQAVKDKELDINEFVKLLEDDYNSSYEEKKKEINTILESEKESLRTQMVDSINKENSELISKNQELKEAIKESENRLDELNQTYTRTEKELQDRAKLAYKASQDALDAASYEYDSIISSAKAEAESILEEKKKELKTIEDNLNEREDRVEDRELEVEAREVAIGYKEKHVNSLQGVYEKANPDKLKSLEQSIIAKDAEIQSIRSEFASAQAELNKIKIRMIHTEGVLPEELQAENEQLIKKVEELENKCNRYTDFQLNEMKNAYDEKDGYLTQIRNLTNEVAADKLELTRLNNAILEYEQLKSQMELLRTLNDHLRNELDNTKRMLESNVGDMCPALSSIDIEETSDSGESYTKSQERASVSNSCIDEKIKIKNLKGLVDHVREYAASQTKPLFYSDDDIRAFIAGLAASPFSILQGMSGTGKTSLPKVFGEAVFGEVNVVSVESSWRDRNELLGYYNDFSKKFTAKEFTCDLYRAGCSRYKDTIYFIVLDEMNLSRVEYYFADFLSVMEDKKDKWNIKLVDTDMRQLPTEITQEVIDALNNDNTSESQEILKIVDKLYEDDVLKEDANTSVSSNDKLRLITYLSDRKFKNISKTKDLVGGPQNLIKGNMIRIPKNVWFIGTANRDESTFEITDKVYDRAQVLNFNIRAKGNKVRKNISQIFLPYSELIAMFDLARTSKKFDAEKNTVLNQVEAVLRKHFRVSYGNRIQDQMNIFVPVYIAAGLDSKNIEESNKAEKEREKELELEAIDYQLTNKVLRKLEYEEFSTDAAAELRKIFEKNNLMKANDWLDWKMRGEE